MGKPNRTKRKSKFNKHPSQPPTFTKKKHKVGRKQVAPNATQIDFKTRRIHLLTQLTSHQDPISHFNTLLSHLRHHNANMRLHAITSLQQLANRDPTLIRRSLSQLIHRLEPLFTDIHVQIQFQSFLSLLFSLTPPDIISPYIPLLLAYLNVALAFPQSSIQNTALGIGRSLLSYYPREISHHAQNILPKYLALLDSHSIPRPDTSRTPTFSQLATPGLSTHALALSHTLEHCRLVFENILSTSTLLMRESNNDVTPAFNPLTSTSVACIPSRGFLATQRPVQLNCAVVSFFSSFLPVAWTHFKEFHHSLSKSSLIAERLRGTLTTLSAIIDTYLLLPQLVTTALLKHVEFSVAKYHTSQKQTWIFEFYDFIHAYFPIEAASLSLPREPSHLKHTADSDSHEALLCYLNHRILKLYISLHTQTTLILRINSDQVLQFIETLALSQDDVTALISILHSLRECKRNYSECECSHLILNVSAVIWNYLQKYANREEVLDFVIFLLEFYFELTNSELMLSVDSILSSLSSLVQEPLTEGTATRLTSSLSRLFRHACASPSLFSSRCSIILPLIQSIPHSEYTQQLQRNIVNLAFFSDLENNEFLDSIYDVITRVSLDTALHLLDVIFASCQIHSQQSQLFVFLRKLSDYSSTNFRSPHSDISISPLVRRAVSYFDQLDGSRLS